ncbi:hypothetical protein T4A_3068 [Trichinella pseudospiralis]|uniref:Uncharacterized protein n=1 Tax=Trichinella pseudospiralis TaxID=6337 RepID=A0A0V1EQA1_TRIPS|nr:hypothetical protein T4A_3068 [Trichinella pseudospiralis]
MEQGRSENADDMKQINRSRTIEEKELSCPLVPPRQALPRSLPTASTPPSPRAGRHDFFRDDPGWISTLDPPSTDRSPRSAEDAASAPDGSFAP